MGKTVLEAKVVDIQKRRYPSKHYVYVIEVTWSEGTQTLIYRRYSKFFEFQCGLLAKFPIQAGEKNPADRCIPFLPGKKILGRSHVRSVAEKRMGPISEYCRSVIRLPADLSQDPYILNFFEVTPEDINPPMKEEKVKKVETANEISDPILLEQYTAIADYKKQKNTECSLSAGQVVEVIDKNDNGWWFVHMDDLNEGWVPATYLEPIYGQNEVTKPIVLDSPETHITTSNYTAKNPDELTFERGVLMEVFEKGMDGWWKAKYLETQGYVPACYLTRYYGTISSGSPTGATEVVSSVQEAIQSTLKPATAPSTSSKVAKPMKAWPLKAGVDPYADEPIYAPTPRKEVVKKSASKLPVIATKVPPVIKKRPSFSEADGIYSEIDDLPTQNNNINDDDDDDEEAFHDYETMSEHYVTIGDFTASVGDGLSFKSGKSVSVITKNPSGWWFVEMDSQEGWVPSSYLEKVFRPQDAVNNKNSNKPKSPPPPKVNKTTTNRQQAVSPPLKTINNDRKSAVSPPPLKPNKPNSRQQTTSPPIPKVTTTKPGVTPSKPKPFVPNKKVTPPAIKTEDEGVAGGGATSVAAMASLLSKGLNEGRSHSVSKPIVPKRVPTKSSDDNHKLSVSHDSVKRSSSSDAIREIQKPAKSKSPPPLKPRPNEFIPPPTQKRLVQSTENSPRMGVKFLRKSTENLADDDSPIFTPKSSTMSEKPRPSPQPTKPRPPSRTSAVNTSSSQTLRLNELEQALSSKKPLPAKRTSTMGVNKKPGPPTRPQTGPAVKKTPPPRPSNSPAQSKRKESIYVTIADFIGTEESSLSFKEGEAVQVVEKSDEGWWFVNIRGKEGWVPSTFIDKTTDKPDRPKPPKPGKKTKPLSPPAHTSQDTYRATGDYETPVYEDSGINLVTGQFYEVLERTDTGWWYVQHGSQEGWAPSSFLEPVN